MAAAIVRGGSEVVAVLKNRNPGITRVALTYEIADETDAKTVVAAARKWQPQVAVVGPEAPLAAGVTDALAKARVPVASPSKAAAEVETDKAFLRDLMRRHALPGAVEARSFSTNEGLREYVRSLGEVAVKPVGLTGGKGVKVSGDQLPTPDDAVAYAEKVLAERIGGASVVIEEKLEGEEFTLMAFCDGTRLAPMPCVQDHKRALEGDRGANTGGMGSYSDRGGLLPFLAAADRDEALRILQAIVDALAKEGRPYRGAVYGQFMLTKSGPKVVEINARFGDPEAMNVLTLLSSNYAEICAAMAAGKLRTKVHFEDAATVCKYVVPKGYGVDSVDARGASTSPSAAASAAGGAGANTPVEVDEKSIEAQGAKTYYAAVTTGEGKITMSGSRALGIVAKGGSIEDAERKVEQALKHVKGEIRVRHDIGTRALLDARVEHMRKVRGG